MKIEIGKIKEQFVTLPKFMLSANRRSFSYTNRWIWKIGRLYRGYVGIMLITPRHEYNLWIANFK